MRGIFRNPATWLTRTAQNHAIDRIRRVQKHAVPADYARFDTFASDAPNPGQPTLTGIPNEQLNRLCSQPRRRGPNGKQPTARLGDAGTTRS